MRGREGAREACEDQDEISSVRSDPDYRALQTVLLLLSSLLWPNQGRPVATYGVAKGQ